MLINFHLSLKQWHFDIGSEDQEEWKVSIGWKSNPGLLIWSAHAVPLTLKLDMQLSAPTTPYVYILYLEKRNNNNKKLLCLGSLLMEKIVKP